MRRVLQHLDPTAVIPARVRMAFDTRAVEIAECLRDAVESFSGPAVRANEGFRVTSSFGVSTMSESSGDTAEMIDQADAALYVAKGAGRNQVKRWNDVATHATA